MANDRFREVIRRAGFDPSLRSSIEEDDGDGEPEEAEARRKGHEVKEVKEPEGVNILGRRHICRPVVLDFGEGFGAALADGRITGVFADTRRIIPAALALCAIGALDLDAETAQHKEEVRNERRLASGNRGLVGLRGDWMPPKFDL